MGLVSKWLETIGLDHVVPTFNAAGIVSPTDLAELDVTHYEALGVSEAADRKKLFYLVQRIKMAVDIVEDDIDDNNNKSSNRTDSKLINSSRSHQSAKQKDHFLSSDESEDDVIDSRHIYESSRGKKYPTKQNHRRKHHGNESENENYNEANYTYDFEEDEAEDFDVMSSFSQKKKNHSQHTKSSLPHPLKHHHQHYNNSSDDNDEIYSSDDEHSVPPPPPENHYSPQKKTSHRSIRNNHNYNSNYNSDDYAQKTASITHKNRRRSARIAAQRLKSDSTNDSYNKFVSQSPSSITSRKKDLRRHDKIDIDYTESHLAKLDMEASSDNYSNDYDFDIQMDRSVASTTSYNTRKSYYSRNETRGSRRHDGDDLSVHSSPHEIGSSHSVGSNWSVPQRASSLQYLKSSRKNKINANSNFSHGHSSMIETKKDSQSLSRKQTLRTSNIQSSKRHSLTLIEKSYSDEGQPYDPLEDNKLDIASSPRSNRSYTAATKYMSRSLPNNKDEFYEHNDSYSESYNNRRSMGTSLQSSSLSKKTSLHGRNKRQSASIGGLIDRKSSSDISVGSDRRKSSSSSRRTDFLKMENDNINHSDFDKTKNRSSSIEDDEADTFNLESTDRKYYNSNFTEEADHDSFSIGDKNNGNSGEISAKSNDVGSKPSTSLRRSSLQRPTSNLQRPTSVQVVRGKTKKRLSTIPSERPAPMSPLLTMNIPTSSQQEPNACKTYASGDDSDSASVRSNSSNTSSRSRGRKSNVRAKSDRETTSKTKTNVRRNSLIKNNEGSDSERSVRSNHTSNSSMQKESRNVRYRRSPVRSGRNPAELQSGSTNLNNDSRSIGSKGRSNSPRRRNVMMQSGGSLDSKESNNDALKLNSSSISTTSGPIFVHGVAEDNSWSAQISRLREENDAAYQNSCNDNYYSDDEEDMRIRVVIRKRPMSKKEASKSGGDIDVIHPHQSKGYGKVHVYQPKTRVDLTKEIENLSFAYDNVFNEDANNVQIYERTIRNLIPGIYDGQWASVFAYGQTGSGKTFTMMGSSLTGMKAGNSKKNSNDNTNFGLYYLAAQDLFHLSRGEEYRHLSVGASLFEIYGGKLYDLLNSRKPVKCLEDHKGQVCFPGLSEHPVSSADQLMNIIESGAVNRSTGSTSANADSSRSHAVLQLSLRKQVGRKSNVEHGRLTFIDLAGSERGADTSRACRTTRLEGAEINTSLLALKEVIRALATGGSMTHIPFRGSKLTQVLKESFVGKHSRTVMVACVAPNMTNCEHTLNTLRYADRVKERDSETGKLTAAVAAASKIPRKKKIPSLSSRPITAPPGESDLDRTSSRKSLIGNDNIFNQQSKKETILVTTEEEIDSIESDCVLNSEDDYESENDSNNFVTQDETASEDDLDNIFKSPDKISVKNIIATSPFLPSKDHTKTKKDDENKSTSNQSKYKSKKEAVQPLVVTHRSVMTEMLGMVKHEMTLVNCTDADRDTIDEYLHELEKVQEKQLSLIGTLRNSLVDYYASRPQSEESNINHADYQDQEEDPGIFSDDSFEDLRE